MVSVNDTDVIPRAVWRPRGEPGDGASVTWLNSLAKTASPQGLCAKQRFRRHSVNIDIKRPLEDPPRHCGDSARTGLARRQVLDSLTPGRGRLIRCAQGAHQQTCRFVAYLIDIRRRPDHRAMTKAKKARHHDLDISFQFTRRCIRSGECGESANAIAIADDKRV